MSKKITRTIKTANVTYQYVDIPTSTIMEDNITLTDNISSETKMLRALKRKFNSATIEVIKITDVKITSQKYAISEIDFIKYADIMDDGKED